MRKPSPSDAIHSLDLIKQIINEAIDSDGEGDCGGDCANCPCSGEEPKSAKKASKKDTGAPCDKC